MPDDAQRPPQSAYDQFTATYQTLSAEDRRTWLRNARRQEQDEWEKEDGEILARVKEWQALVRECEDAATPHSWGLLRRQIKALEGQILHDSPNAFQTMVGLLTIAHTILSAKDIDRDHAHHSGVATLIVANVADRLSYY